MTEFLKKLNLSEKEYAEANQRFADYCKLLLEWNEKFNLTAITDPSEIYLKHFADSVLGLPFVKGKVLDIGAGAGFPSLPLKIASSSLDVTMVDSLEKRVRFLGEVISALSLNDIRAVHSRAEDLDKTIKYDTVVSRAVAPLNILCEYCLPFVKIGGNFVAYKSDKIDDEVTNARTAVNILGGIIHDIVSIPLADSGIIRTLVIIKKVRATPSAYPRGGNKPKKFPICG